MSSSEDGGAADGYKEVQLGPKTLEVPEEWDYVYFSDAIERNPRYDKPDRDTFDFVPMDAVSEEHQTIEYWTEREKDDCTTTWFKNEDTIYAKITPCAENGKIAFVEGVDTELASGSTEFIVFHPKEGVTEPKYVFYLANLPEFRAVTISLMEGSTARQRIPNDIFDENLRIPLPPLPEQRRIADILSTVDEEIQQTEEIIKGAMKLKLGLEQNILVQGIQGHDRSEKWLGPKRIAAPDHWEVISLGKLCSVMNGTRVPKEDSYAESETKHPFIRISDMRGGSIRTDELEYVTSETAEKMTRGLVSKGDAYITVTGRIGDAGVVPSELDGAYLTDNAARMSDFEAITRDYLITYLRSKLGHDEVHRLSIGTTQPKLSIYRVKKIKILVPPIEEQEQISSIFRAVDEKIRCEKEKKSGLQRLKRGLMQDLLTGKVRVT